MNDSAAYYNGFYAELAEIDRRHGSFDKIQPLFLESPSKPKLNVLDIGCGYGAISEDLVRRGHNVYGMEINEQAIKVLEEKKFRVLRTSMTEPFKIDTQFDWVLLLDVLEHVFDPLTVLNNAREVLKPDGKVIISIPLYFDPLDRLRILFTGNIVSYDNRCYGQTLYKRFKSFNYDHIRFFRPSDIESLATASGLKVEKTIYGPCPAVFGPFNYIVRLLSNRYTANLFPGLLAHSALVRLSRS